MQTAFYKLGLTYLDKIRNGNYDFLKNKVIIADLIRIYNKLVADNDLLPIEKLDNNIKQELKDWAKQIGYGNNVILGINICKILYLLTFDFSKILK
jgi:hypothetical protein